MQTRQSIRFLRNETVVELTDVDPTRTVLDYLRLTERRCGTKEGCAEGDCGACTVAVGSLIDGDLHYEPINSCIHFLGMLDGKHLITVDDLAPNNQTLHPVQQAMVDQHGSQCGFCTPGFVMSLFTLYHHRLANDASGDGPVDTLSRHTINDWLAGNLCRCTGYRPIIEAALQSCNQPLPDRYTRTRDAIINQLSGLDHARTDIFCGSSEQFFAAPSHIDTLAQLALDHPDATIVAGATDVGLWVTKQLRHLPKIIYTGRVQGLRDIHHSADEITFGAAVTYAQAFDSLSAIDPDIGEVLRRLGSRQIRASGTIGGNIANGSPIGDSPPLLMALDAVIYLRRGQKRRRVPLTQFFIDYGKQDRMPGEFIESIVVKRLRPDQHLRSYKISKRFDQDISALLGAFRFDLDESGTITDCVVAYGGMAATPKRAASVEHQLRGAKLKALLGSKVTNDDRDDNNGNNAQSRSSPTPLLPSLANALDQDFSPISDMRASADYRITTAQQLLYKAIAEVAGLPDAQCRLVGHRSDASVGLNP